MLSNADLIRVGVCVAFGLILCGLRLKLVLYVDAIFSIVSGVCSFLYAADSLSQYTAGISVDFQHEYLVQFRVIMLVMPGLVWLLSQKSIDVTVRTALGISRVLSCGAAVIVMGIAHMKTDSFTTFHLLYSVLPCGLWTLVMLAQLVRTGSRVNIKLRRLDVNNYMTVDMILLFLISLSHMIFPGYLYQLMGLRLDALHVYLHRINGAVMLGLAAHSWIGQRFRYAEDKHNLLFSRCVCSLVWLGRTGFACMTGQLPPQPATYCYLGLVTAIFLPSFLGCLLTPYGPFTKDYWNGSRRSIASQESTVTDRTMSSAM